MPVKIDCYRKTPQGEEKVTTIRIKPARRVALGEIRGTMVLGLFPSVVSATDGYIDVDRAGEPSLTTPKTKYTGDHAKEILRRGLDSSQASGIGGIVNNPYRLTRRKYDRVVARWEDPQPKKKWFRRG